MSDSNFSREERLASLWTDAHAAVSAFVCTFIRDSHTSKDVMQKIAVVIVKKFDEYDPSKPFVAWAIGIARFEVLHERRRQAREKLVFDEDFLDRVTESFQRQNDVLEERRVALRSCLSKLDPLARELIDCRYVIGKSPQEIAAERRRSPESIRMGLMRIRQLLRVCIDRQLVRDES